MGRHDYTFLVPKTFVCGHGTNRYFGPCSTCNDEAEAERQLERARVRDPAWVIEQAIRRRSRWFDGCAFCVRRPDMVVWSHHEHGCPFVAALAEARIAYGLHLVDVSEGRTVPSPSEGKP